ncbi:MAG TPA: hypothetical protein VGM89_10110 [Puia sp.]
MAYFFALLSFASLSLLLIGLIRPSVALFWQKSGATRKKSAFIYFLITLVSLVLTGLTAPPEMRKAEKEKDAAAADGRAGSTDASAARLAAVLPRRPSLPMSPERQERRTLGKRVDTTYQYLEDSLPFDHDTGYLVPFTFGDSPDEPVEGKEIIDALIQTGPRQYGVNKDHKLRAYMPVWVLGGQMERRRGHSHGLLWVAPLGSADSFLISTDNFSLKNPAAGNLVQRASNHAYVKAVYTAPADPNKRPVDFAGRWIDVPKDASIVVTRYDNSSGKLEAKIFDGDDKVGEAYFDVSTLTPAP